MFGSGLREIRPLVKDAMGLRMWGLPLESSWWRNAASDADARAELEKLIRGSQFLDGGGPATIAAGVAAALERLGPLAESGLEIEGRRYAELGQEGYVAMALAIGRAHKATVLDRSEPSAWAVPVLKALGVEIQRGGPLLLGIPNIDSLWMHQSDQLTRILTVFPEVSQLIVPELSPVDIHWFEEQGWQVTSVTFEGSFFCLSEERVRPRGEAEPEGAYLCRGSKLPRPFPQRP